MINELLRQSAAEAPTFDQARASLLRLAEQATSVAARLARSRTRAA